MSPLTAFAATGRTFDSITLSTSVLSACFLRATSCTKMLNLLNAAISVCPHGRDAGQFAGLRVANQLLGSVERTGQRVNLAAHFLHEAHDQCRGIAAARALHGLTIRPDRRRRGERLQHRIVLRLFAIKL